MASAIRCVSDGIGMEPEDIEFRFEYVPPTTEEKRYRHEQVRAEFKAFAFLLYELLPHTRETALAFQRLEEAHFWAQAALARHGHMRPLEG